MKKGLSLLLSGCLMLGMLAGCGLQRRFFRRSC